MKTKGPAAGPCFPPQGLGARPSGHPTTPGAARFPRKPPLPHPGSQTPRWRSLPCCALPVSAGHLLRLVCRLPPPACLHQGPRHHRFLGSGERDCPCHTAACMGEALRKSPGPWRTGIGGLVPRARAHVPTHPETRPQVHPGDSNGDRASVTPPPTFYEEDERHTHTHTRNNLEIWKKRKGNASVIQKKT